MLFCHRRSGSRFRATRAVSFAGLQPGTYRVTVHGDDLDTVSDVFLVLPSS